MRKIVYILMVSILVTACKSSQKMPSDSVGHPDRDIIFAKGPQTIIYKTNRDFSNSVPVIMDAKKEKIVSYPALTDIYYNGKLAKPTALKNNYWLDNRGINENVAFLSYTYEEYAQLKEVPSMEMLKTKIIERYPLQEMYQCGLRSQYKEEILELNALIDSGFKNCRKVKILSMSIVQ